MRAGELTEKCFDEGARLTFEDVAADSLSNPTVLKVRLKATPSELVWTSL